MRKPPQERKTPIEIDHDHYEQIRINGQETGLGLEAKREVGRNQFRYQGFHLHGPEGIRQLRDICNEWLEHHEEQQEDE